MPEAGVLLEHATDMLYEQKDTENSYKAYRSELTTFLHWCLDVSHTSPANLSRKDITQYVEYCKTPPDGLIGYFNVAQFKLCKANQIRVPNPAWRPFVGKKIDGKVQPYVLSDNALKTKIAILSSFYAYLMSEDFCQRNPAQAWLNHSRFALKKKFSPDNYDDSTLSFTELQWSYIMTCVDHLALINPQEYRRSQFLIKLMYSCYLRISEVAARAG